MGMESFGQRLWRRGGWLVVAFLVATPFLMSFAGLGNRDFEFCETWGALPGDDKIKRDGDWFLLGEPVGNRQPCDGDDLWHYRGFIHGIDAVVWADCEVTWIDGRRSTAEAEGLDRCW